MLEQGVIEPSTNPIIPLLITHKKKIRCIWTKETLSDTYPFSNMTDILDQLGIVQEFLFRFYGRDHGVNCKYSNHTKVPQTVRLSWQFICYLFDSANNLSIRSNSISFCSKSWSVASFNYQSVSKLSKELNFDFIPSQYLKMYL
jgi:hypothetical protein